MRVAITFAPGGGHFQAVLPVWEDLRRAGHDVKLFGSTLAAKAFSLSRLVVSSGPSSYRPNSFRKGTNEYRRAEDAIVAAMAFESFCDLRERFHAWTPDVLIRDTSERGSLIAADYFDIPLASIISCANAALFDIRERERRWDSFTRRRHGIDFPRRASLRDQLVALGPPALLGGLEVKEPSRHFRYEPATIRRPPSPKNKTSKSFKTALIAFGSYMREPSLGQLLHVVHGLTASGCLRVMIKIRDSELRAMLHRRAPFVEIIDGNDLLGPLSVCDVFVGHGGANSTIEAMYYGAAPLVIPFHNDGFFVASRVAAGGYGASVDAQVLCADAISEAVDSMTTSRSALARFGRENSMLGQPSLLLTEVFSPQNAE